MATILDILVIPTYDKFTLGVMDNSDYDIPPVNPELTITCGGFDPVTFTFVPDVLNIIDSATLGLTQVGEDTIQLPDGVYTILYTTDTDSVEKNFMKVDLIQEKFDEAFMKLDMMECDKAIKTQAKVELSTVWFLIQGAVAAANNCAVIEANKLYQNALKALQTFINNKCGCFSNNYVINIS